MNAVIYARYSPGPRQTEQSIEGQIRDCEAYAKERDIKILKVYADRHISGTDFERRQEFKKMIADAEKNKFDAVIVWKVDRFGRDREEIALNKIRLKRNGVKLLYAKEVIPDGPEGIILESLMEGLAEYYVADLRQKVKRGMRESALKGLAVSGMAAYGYAINNEKKYVINESEAWVVRWVFEKYKSGMTATEILEALKKMGVKNRKGGEITKNGIYTMLRNEKYTGKCTYDNIPIPLPRIIPQELWESCQAKIIRRPHSSAVYKALEKYALSLKVYCGECGALMLGESGHGKSGQRYSYYKCSTRKRKGGSALCQSKVYRRDQLEDYIAECTVKDVLQDDVIELISDRVMKILEKPENNYELDSLKTALKDAEKSKKNILRAIEDGIYTSSTKDRLMELEDQIEEIKIEIAKLDVAKPNITHEQVVFWLNSFKKGDIKDPAFVQRLFDVFIHSVYIYKEKVVIAYNYTDNNHYESLDISEVERCSDIFGSVKDQGLYSNFRVLLKPPVFFYIHKLSVA